MFVLLCPLLAIAQETQQIKGQVLDAADGKPLAGATVFINPSETQAKNYNPQGTVVGNDGRFLFTLPASVKTVVVSFLGYEPMTVDITRQKDLTVRLKAAENQMDAVVVTGYQKIEKRKLTSSIATVDMDDINRIGVASVDQMLAGQLAGVVSTPTTGAPGAGSVVKIRSTATLNGTTDPLWVLDGIPLEGNDIPKEWSSKENIDNLYNMSIAGLNPEDIKDITVLKDAAATAIYGARAANGVIVITTKKGQRNRDAQVNVSAATFITTRPKLEKLNLMNASEKVDLELQMAMNGRQDYLSVMGGVARILDGTTGERQALRTGGFSALQPETQQKINALRKDGTDWGKEIYRVAVNQQYGLSISGGREKMGYYFSAGYYNEQGTTKGTGFERLNMTLKTDYDLLKNLNFGVSLYAGQNKNKSYITDTDAFTSPSRYTRIANPYLNAYDENGQYVYDPDMTVYSNNVEEEDRVNFNFLEEMAGTNYEMKVRSLKSIFDLSYKPIEGLNIFTQLGLQVDNSATEKSAREDTYFVRKYRKYSEVDDGEGNKVPFLPKGGVIQNWNTDFFQYTWKAQAEYSKRFNRIHEMDLMAGLEMRGSTNTDVHTKGFGYDYKTMTTKPLVFPDNHSGIENNRYFTPYQKTFSENRYLSYFFTGSYTYDNRYTFFGSMRYDGTNLFGVDPKYKFNPMWSVSGAWNVRQESFMRDVRWISNLRLRGSYGAQGNVDRTTSPYIIGTWTTGNISGGLTEDRIEVTSPPNRNLRWETTYSWNAAVDLGVLENRINATFEVYGRRSENLITTRAIPHETGFTSTSSNYGKISSKGIELTLRTVNIARPNFRWETQFNLAHNTDKVDQILVDENSWAPSKLGHSSSAIFAIRMAGLDGKGVPMIWKDGKKVSLQDFVNFKVEKTDPYGIGWYQYNPSMDESYDAVMSYYTCIGDRNPDFTGGFNNRFYFKGFDLTISCNFVINQLMTRTPFYSPTETNPGLNYTQEMNQVWSPSNPNGIYPALTGGKKPDGTAYEDWSEWDDLRAMNYIFNSKSRINIFNSLDIWTKEMSYFRVNSIRLGYTFPKKIVEKLRLGSLRVNFEARNPFVIATNYDGYFDPENWGNIYTQPLARTYSFGLNVTF